MNKSVYSLLLFLIFIFAFPQLSFANIITGDESVETHVVNINDNGNVKNRVETIVNGKTRILESSKGGELNVTNINGEVAIEKKEATQSEEITLPESANKAESNAISAFIEGVKNFVSMILDNLFPQ